MIIGFDAKRAVSNNTGLGNYSRLVIEALAGEFPRDSLLLYVPVLEDNPRLKAIRQFPNADFRLPAPQSLRGSLWRTFGITNHLRADSVEIYHGLSNELPLNIRDAGVPAVVTIHDLIFRRLPECYKPVDRLIYDFKYGRSCRNADWIIAVSRRTKDDIVEIYGIDPERIDVVYQGCDPGFNRVRSAAQLEEVRRRLRLPDKFLLQVGTVEKRKNLELTVRALSALPSDVSLVAVGKDHYGYKKHVMSVAEAAGVASRILWLEGISFDDLQSLNRLADIVCYPSRYEGFGIPVLEGITSGRPVVAATGSCLEEAGGVGALYVDPDIPRDMAAALNSILTDGSLRERLIGEGQKHAALFDIADIASNTRRVYEKVLHQHLKASD